MTIRDFLLEFHPTNKVISKKDLSMKGILWGCLLLLVLLDEIKADSLLLPINKETKQSVVDQYNVDKVLSSTTPLKINPLHNYMSPLSNSQYQITAEDHIYGELSAQTSIISYMDFDCPYCRKLRPVLKRIVNRSNGQVNWIFRHFPLTGNQPNSGIAAEFSECADKIAGNRYFWKFSDALLMQPRRNKPSLQVLINRSAQLAQIDIDELKTCQQSKIYRNKIDSQTKEAIQLGAKGTPAMLLLNKTSGKQRFLQGSASLNTLLETIKKISK